LNSQIAQSEFRSRSVRLDFIPDWARLFDGKVYQAVAIVQQPSEGQSHISASHGRLDVIFVTWMSVIFVTSKRGGVTASAPVSA
jgi:hypothetical protein